MLDEKKIIVEIFRPERGSCYTIGRSVLELPLFSTEVQWVHCSEARTDFVLDMRFENYPISLIKFFSVGLMELCNKKWNECIENNLDRIVFEYKYD